jgi:DNA-binding transcriptional LysR family regulator
MFGDDLRDLGAFAAVARTRNFRRAAREQNISVSSLSQRMSALEERLGMRLLNRTTRSVAPTEAGEALLARLGPALGEIEGAIDAAQGQRDVPAGRLRINAPLPAVHTTLAPMTVPFLKKHPAIKLELILEPALIDIVEGGFDAGVRYEEDLAKDMIALSLGPRERFVVVAASKLAAGANIRKPADLLEQPCITTILPNRRRYAWEFEKNGRSVRFTPDGPLATMHIELQLQAAIAGVGFLKTFEIYAQPAIAAGKLVTVLDDWCPTFPGPFLYYPSRRQMRPALAAFIAFVKEWRAKEKREK